MYYLAYISHDYQCKNNLEKEILKYLQGIERMFFPEKQLSFTKDHILNRIRELNEAHPRCKPIKASFRDSDKKQDAILQISGICHFTLLKTN